MIAVAARIIGIGQAAAGDDGAGIAMVRRLQELGVPGGIELLEAAEPSALIPWLLEGAETVVLVDAVVGGGPFGQVIFLEPGEHPPAKGRLLSTHGLGVMEAIELARTIGPQAARRIVVVGITIGQPTRYGEGLSPAVADAVGRAAGEALRIAAG